MPEQHQNPSEPGRSIQTISVIVPANPFVRDQAEVPHCLAALSADDLMRWWPGTPHLPHRNPAKVEAIQRSLDWKRVAQIAAYLLQKEILDAPDRIKEYFTEIYASKADEPGREWPPKIPRVVKFQRSEYPTFANVLLHVNGARVEHQHKAGRQITAGRRAVREAKIAHLVFDESDADLNFSVIDGQHRINGAFLAVQVLREKIPGARWDIPAEVFLDLDKKGEPPRRQAQIFIDVNFYQKKVDRSLVADLFPTARGKRESLDHKERAQDLGRKLMLEIGPLVGMVQIPGIKYGVPDVVTLATLNTAIEDVLPDLTDAGIQSLNAQADFLALCLEAWLVATGRKDDLDESGALDPENVAYQGRAIVSFLTLVPACINVLRQRGVEFNEDRASSVLQLWLRGTMKRAGLIKNGKFLGKREFKAKGYLGSGGLARFRDRLWVAAASRKAVSARMTPERLTELAAYSRLHIRQQLGTKRED